MGHRQGSSEDCWIPDFLDNHWEPCFHVHFIGTLVNTRHNHDHREPRLRDVHVVKKRVDTENSASHWIVYFPRLQDFDESLHAKWSHRLEGIGEYAFFGCSLSSLKIPKSVWMIGDSAFSACSRLTSVTIPDNVWIIGNHAFCACTSLVTIVLHTQLVCVGVGAFGCCTSLKVMLVRRAFNPNRNAETPYIPWESCVLVANDVVPVEPMQHVWAKLMEPLGNIEDELDHLEHPVKDTLAASSFPRETFRETMRGMLNCPGNRPGAFDSAPPEFEEMGGCTTDVGSLRIWAPNDVIEFLTGPFAAYNTLSDVPASMRAAPGQRSWKGILLWSKHYHNECTICGEHGARKCEGCFRTQYCSKQCQQTHWRNGGHKEECKLPTFSSTALFKTIAMAI